MLKENLLQIGFTENESKVYLTLLKMGAQAVSVIANKTDLNRTTTYSILKSLQEKGMVSSYSKERMTFFVANDPNFLVAYVDRQCRTYSYYKEQILSSIPKFRSLAVDYQLKRPIIRYFEGIEGVKNVMYDALNSEGIFRACLTLDEWQNGVYRDFLLEYRHFRVSRGVIMRALVPDSTQMREFVKENYALFRDISEFRYVDPEANSALFANETHIYNERVAIMNLRKGEEYGVLVDNKAISLMQMRLFDLVWDSF